MLVQFEHRGTRFSANTSEGISIAIGLDFDGAQPSHFGASPASRTHIETNGFVGRVSKGGSCNVDIVTLNPHCNGTHTESVGHIVTESVPIGGVADPTLLFCKLISVTPKPATNTSQSYRPEFQTGDRVIDHSMLELSMHETERKIGYDALVIRSLPNLEKKRSWQYGPDDLPSFFTIEAINWIVDLGVKHLLVDLPSIDRMHDEGLLTNHHLFWGVPEGKHSLGNNAASVKTITEMVFIPDHVEDGHYLLNLQLPAFCLDAAPSRPVLYPILKKDD